MSDNGGLAKLVPGFEFLQNLAKGAGATMPGVGHWIAPTLDPEELDKRIEELRTVKFWLEQNGRLLDTTIQALEVQRMTLATLQTMNVQMSDLREAMMIRTPPPAPQPAPGRPPAPATHAPEAPPEPPAASTDEPHAAASSSPAASAIDPMQWWGALTQQFTSLATSALQNTAATATMPAPSDAASHAHAPESAAKAGQPRRAVKPPASNPSTDSPLPRKKPVRRTPGR